jgi:protein-tyrosine-phosphatase
MAEVIFHNLCIANGRTDVTVASAGISPPVGVKMTVEAFDALRICGEEITKNMVATQFEPKMISQFDLIITMAEGHKRVIGSHYANVKTLDEFVGCGDILDPYLYPLETYISVCELLQKSLGVLYNRLFGSKGELRCQ